ncbi:unnamed protein product [Arabis nemorensis]|uniref:Uncharacterized protein n=1 Tax=Arabis nemorensis TaxID=586526 RepID=A0A565CPG3_9BRAS|nr:unnamed protein product [Arabis nemorensis]
MGKISCDDELIQPFVAQTIFKPPIIGSVHEEVKEKDEGSDDVDSESSQVSKKARVAV